MIFNTEVSDIVLAIESGDSDSNQYKRLIHAVEQSLKDSNNIIDEISHVKIELGNAYPVKDQYAVSFDPLTQSLELLETWHRYGMVVGSNVVNDANLLAALGKMQYILSSFNLRDSSMYPIDSNGTPFISRGFFELYHDNTLAQVRQSIRLYLYHALLWRSSKLWTSYDRLGLKPPFGESSLGLGLHVDQNPTVHPGFTTIQGVLALADNSVENGTFVAVPGSIPDFDKYAQFIKPGYRGEFISLDEGVLYERLHKHKQNIPLKMGSIVSWDSRTTHANSSNLSDRNRYVFYVSTGLAKNDPQLIKTRNLAFETGLGENSREAYLHASKKPRFTDSNYLTHVRDSEELTLLGECLYSVRSYEDL